MLNALCHVTRTITQHGSFVKALPYLFGRVIDADD